MYLIVDRTVILGHYSSFSLVEDIIATPSSQIIKISDINYFNEIYYYHYYESLKYLKLIINKLFCSSRFSVSQRVLLVSPQLVNPSVLLAETEGQQESINMRELPGSHFQPKGCVILIFSLSLNNYSNKNL